jgi:hypothetical protein
MSNQYRFGIWTFAVVVGWVAGLILAFLMVWHLWTDWFSR